MNELILSIIVPVYNVEKYIYKCLLSLYNQTMNNFEVIIVNDGTTDRSIEICKDFIGKNKITNFKIVNKQNGGLSDARNYGLKFVKGKYVCFLDADDYVENDAYKKLCDFMEKNDFDFAECNYFMDFNNKSKIIELNKYDSLEMYLSFGCVTAWNKIFKTEFIANNNLSFPVGYYYEDIAFFYTSSTRVSDYSKIGHLFEPLIHYVQREGSIMTISDKKILDILKIYDYILANVDSKFYGSVEYRCIRNLHCSFYKKINLISDKKERKIIKSEFKKYIDLKFPNWRLNSFLKINSLSNIYIRAFSSYLFR